jgi:hypothetical protein
MREGIFRETSFIEDKTGITLSEAKELWNTHYPDAANWINKGNTVEMVIWIDMVDENAYDKSLQYISTDAESDGVNIWVKTVNTFTKY